MNLGLGVGFDDDDDIKQQTVKRNIGAKSGGPHGQQGMPFDVACAEGNLSNAVLLWAQGSNINQPDVNGYTPLMYASLKNQVVTLRFLLDQGVHPNYASPDGQTSLMWAATEGALEAGKVLLEGGADPDQVDQHGYTAACLAVQNGNLSFLHMLHSFKPIDPNLTDNDGHHLTTWACYKGEFHILQYLHEVLGVPVNGMDNNKRTSLHWCAREGHTECAIYLMARGLSVSATDSDGLTPIDHAQQRYHVPCEEALRKQVKEQTNYCVGSLHLLTTNRTQLFNSLSAIVYFVAHYFWSLWSIPVWAHMPISLYMMKNMWYSFIRRTPIKASAPETSLLADIGAPKTVMGALRGPLGLRRRETANMFATAGFISVQYIVSMSTGVPLPPLYLPLTAIMAVAAVICKIGSTRSNIVEPGSAKDDPSLPVIEKGEFSKLHPRVYDQVRHVRVPLRAFYCYEYDRIIRRFDNFSVLLDCPISYANQRSFVIVLFSFWLMQLLTLINSWNFFTEKHCPADHEFTVLRTLWNMAFSCLPCGLKPLSESWYDWWVPQPHNVAGVWLFMYCIPMTGAFGAVLWRQLGVITHGVSRAEFVDPTAVNTKGEMESIKRPHGYVFSDSGKFGNFVMFWLGKMGERWESIQALPAK